MLNSTPLPDRSTLPDGVLRLPDGRTVGVAAFGSPEGIPVLALHGMPGSRLMYATIEEAAKRHGVRVIAIDRPGYGRSDPDRGGTLLGYAEDVARIADLLGLERFGVLGTSGGGSYALACGARLGRRLSSIGVISGMGPLRSPGSLSGMASVNAMVFRLARLSPALVGAILPRLIRRSLPQMEAQVTAGGSLTPTIPPEVFAVIVADQREAIRQGGAGIRFDAANLWRPWGFRLADVRVAVHLWHGESDNLAPVSLAHRMAVEIPNCEATFYPGEGHAEPLTRHAGDVLEAFAVAWSRISVTAP
jgi:pimeloyl-ACP methyl ester carboxylesterase